MKDHIKCEDLHYGVLPCFPSMLWSARELVPLVMFVMSLGTVPIEAFLNEAVPIFLFENCLPLYSVVQLLEGDCKSTGYTGLLSEVCFFLGN